MKRTALILLGLLLLAGPAASMFRIELQGSYFSSENSIFKDVYGRPAKLGFELGLGIAKNLSLWAGMDYVQKKGGLTITDEETQVRLIPVGAGLRYEIPAAPWLLFHAAVGVQEVFFREESALGTVEKSALGYTAKGGLMVRISKAVGLDLFAGWSTCKMKNEDIDFKVGGLDLGGGLEFRF